MKKTLTAPFLNDFSVDMNWKDGFESIARSAAM